MYPSFIADQLSFARGWQDPLLCLGKFILKKAQMVDFVA